MGINAVCLLTGVLWLQCAAALPAWARWGWAVALVSVVISAWAARAGRRWRARSAGLARVAGALGLAAVMLAGYGYAAWRAELRLADGLDPALEGRDLNLSGVIASLPDDNGDGVRFVFEVDAGVENTLRVPHQIWLSWYRTSAFGRTAQVGREVPDLVPGERWRLPVRLKLPHGAAVPGGFDYEAWLLARGLRATGYVTGTGERLAAAGGGFMFRVHRLRQEIRRRFETALPDAPYRGVLVALAVGDQGAIDDTQWEVLRRTGVQHLVAISGLHVALVALAVGGLAAVWWRRVPWLVLRCPARCAAAVAGLGAAVGYALLAGMGIPVQRALIMLTLVALALVSRREVSARQVLACALLAVLVVDPWAVLAAGFWLSFGAVAVILLTVGGRVAPVRGWRGAARLQLAITLATIPVLVTLFQGFSLVAPLANTFAIPLVSFVITPLVLAAALIPVDAVLELAHGFTDWMMAALQWLASSGLALREQALPPPWQLAAASVAMGLLILPRGTPGRLAALAVVGGFFLWQPARPGAGDFHAAILDVGQGLAVHVQTAGHDLLFDTGPGYGRSNAGERTVYPYLRALGVRRLDAVLISHDDSDHAGGAGSVFARVEVDRILAGVSFGAEHDSVHTKVEPCVAGAAWQWDEVRFAVLAPEALPVTGRRDNGQSCVLRVSASSGASLLLMGDVERGGEGRLVARYGSALATTAVVAGHHGSKSSSAKAFVAATHPEVAIFSAGYRNRYGHPHPQVLERWTGAGARNLRTDSDGTILLDAGAQGLTAVGWRELQPRYWHGR